jgi:NADP-dependent aldehyde dehydrogenase
MVEEVFGPSTLLVSYETPSDLLRIADALEGQLTASLFGEEKQLSEFEELLDLLETKAGRLLFNQFPTGVEVCPSVVHGGPYPATTDGRSTSVGTGAILRFARPVCYQGFPDHLLPDELKEGNPMEISRHEA